jgi:predicted lipoprotein
LGASSAGAAELSTAVLSFCEAPDLARQEIAQEAWRQSKVAWSQALLATWFGPAQMLRTVSRVDYEPVNAEGIEALLESAEVLDVDYVLNQAASTERGLGTIEHLLFDSLGRSGDPRVCELMASTAAVVASETLGLEEAWTVSYQEGTPYVEAFAGEGMTSDDAMADAVSAIVESLKQMSLFQLGKALAISSQEAIVEAIPEGRAGGAASAYLAQLVGIRSLLDAGETSSLGALIQTRSDEIAALIDEHLAAAIEELADIDSPLRQIAADDPAQLDPLYDHLSELLTLFEADVVSLLDITLGFSDADGDSG